MDFKIIKRCFFRVGKLRPRVSIEFKGTALIDIKASLVMASEQPVIIAKNFRSEAREIGARYFSSLRNLKKLFRDDFIFDSQSLSI